MTMSVTFETIVSHAKSTGFVFQGSEIYGGLANTWDFGPLGVELKDNIKKAWWLRFIQTNPYNVGIQSAILMNPKVWEASGHLSTFSDPLMDCKHCKTRHRADKLIDAFSSGQVIAATMSKEAMEEFIKTNRVACPHCGSHDFTDIRQFNLMFKTFQGVVEDAKSAIYLRPETAQGMFVNFKNVQRSMRKKIPFGIGQIGKSFRNEITPGNFIFRTREFEQMELEFFCKPGEDLQWYAYWKETCMIWLTDLGLKAENLRIREHDSEELSFYSAGTSDIEYRFPWGFDEIWGIADRTDYDLKQHTKFSGETLDYLDPITNERYVPYCVEPAVGVERLFLSFLTDAYEEQQLENDTRIVLHFHPYLAPYKAAVLPLSKQLGEQAMALRNQLATQFMIDYDETGSIGKRYRRQDAIGTPYCITIDFDTINDGMVTIRERDSMQQQRLPMDQVAAFLQSKITF
jgi:glycyl-tRNA synthetase